MSNWNVILIGEEDDELDGGNDSHLKEECIDLSSDERERSERRWVEVCRVRCWAERLEAVGDGSTHINPFGSKKVGSDNNRSVQPMSIVRTDAVYFAKTLIWRCEQYFH